MRPTKYKEEYASIAKTMCRIGATDIEICEALKIHKATFYRWKSEHKEFCDSLKIGKKVSDDRVERSLYERALGYTHHEDDIRVVNGQIEITPTLKHYPPDPTSAIFWLKNRRPKEWRNNPEDNNKQESKPINVTFRLPTEEEVKAIKNDD